MLDAELDGHRVGVGLRCQTEPLVIHVLQNRGAEPAELSQQLGDAGLDRPGGQLLDIALGPYALLGDVVRAAGLRPGADGRTLPPTEGLALHDCTGDAALHVGIAHLDPLAPIGGLVAVDGVDATGQSEASGVLPLDRLVQVLGMHDARDRAEGLVLVVPAARLHVIANARAPQGPGLVQLLRLDQPLLALIQLAQCPVQLLAGCLDDAVHVRGDVGATTHLDGLHGIHQLVHEALVLGHRAHGDDQGGCGALLTRVAEGGLVNILHRQIWVRGRGDDDGVLAGGLRVENLARVPAAEQLRGLRGSREDHGLHVRVADQALAGLVLVGVDQLEQVLADTGLAHGLDEDLGDAQHLGRGLEDHGGTSSQRGRHTTHRDRHGEVPRRGDHDDLVRGEVRTAVPVELAGGFRVVVRHVDGLGDLRVGLRDRLIGLEGRGGDQAATVVRQGIGDLVQQLGTLRAGLLPPRPLVGLNGALHDLVDLRRVGDQRRLCRTGVCLRGEQAAGPLAVLRQSGIGVRLIEEVARDGAARGTNLVPGLLDAVLGAARPVIGRPAVGDGVPEALLLVFHRRQAGVVVLFGGEQCVEEVLLRTVFLQAADQVGDGDVEVLLADDGRVEDQVAGLLLHLAGLGGGHALQHLDVQLFGHAPLFGELVGERHVIDVVAGHADADSLCVLGVQHPVDQAQVVGVDLRLRQIRGLRPVVHLRIHPLHGEVRALDQAHLDLRATLRHALLREFSQSLERVEGVRQVGLQDDPDLQVEELLLGEKFGE